MRENHELPRRPTSCYNSERELLEWLNWATQFPNEGSTFPWAEILDWPKRKRQAEYPHSPFCFLTVGARWPHAPPFNVISDIVDCSLNLWARERFSCHWLVWSDDLSHQKIWCIFSCPLELHINSSPIWMKMELSRTSFFLPQFPLIAT